MLKNKEKLKIVGFNFLVMKWCEILYLEKAF